MLLSREELCKQRNSKCKGPGQNKPGVFEARKVAWSRVRGKGSRGDEAKRKAESGSKSDRKLLEDLKQGSWEVMIYI